MNLTETDQFRLFYLARKSLESEFHDKPIMIDVKEKALLQRMGVFVTLTDTNGQKRGSSGYIEPSMPLWKAVAQSIKLAAFHDYRTPSVQSQELEFIKIQIRIITSMKEEKEKVSLEGKGIVVRIGPMQAILFPEETTGLDYETVIGMALKKINMPIQAKNSSDCQIYIFESEVLEENKTYLYQGLHFNTEN